jgi:hypothetical protein
MLPRSLIIHGHRYSVKQVKAGELGKSNGEVDLYRHIIKIYKGLAASRKMEFLLHEALHAMLASLDLPEDEEEKVVTALAEYLIEFFQGNPKLLDHLQKTLAK